MKDSFKINWSETSKGYNTVSITGYSYQIDAWQVDFLKKYPKSEFETKIITQNNIHQKKIKTAKAKIISV